MLCGDTSSTDLLDPSERALLVRAQELLHMGHGLGPTVHRTYRRLVATARPVRQSTHDDNDSSFGTRRRAHRVALPARIPSPPMPGGGELAWHPHGAGPAH